MSTYVFEADAVVTTEDLTCLLCKKLMIDACQTVCGCQFCYKCINEHLDSGLRYCPGGKPECNDEFLQIDRDIIRNIRINNKIYKLSVLCPNHWCKSIFELSQMADHLALCINQPSPCPFAGIGCGKEDASTVSASAHLQHGADFHSQLLIDCIQNMKKDLDMNRSDIESLREETKMKNIHIEELTEQLKTERSVNRELKEDKREIFYLIEKQNKAIKDIKHELLNERNTMVKLEQQLKDAKQEIDVRLSAIIGMVEKTHAEELIEERELRNGSCVERENIKSMIDDMRDHVNEIWRRSKNVSTNVDKLSGDLSGVKTVQQKDALLMNKLRKDIIAFQRKLDNEDKRMQKWIKWNKLCPNVDADFVWKIDGWSKRIEEMTETVRDIFSEPFYSNGYRLCLRLWINGDNILLCCVILPGEKDDSLEWPMRLTMTLCIIDQETMLPFKRLSFQVDTHINEDSFQRPGDQRNDYIGVYPFVLHSVIIKEQTVIVNDTIVASCLLSDP